MAIDLDKARAARREKMGQGPEIVFGGITYELSPEIPFGMLEAFRGLSDSDPSAIADIAKALLGKHYDAFLATDPPPSLDDFNELIGGVLQEYGVSSPLGTSTS